MPSDAPWILVGGDRTVVRAVEGLRDGGYDGPVVLVSPEPQLPYDARLLPTGYLAGDLDEDALTVRPGEWYAEHSVELRLGTAVRDLDRVAREVDLADGGRLAYGKLLLATGAVPGPGIAGAHHLCRSADAARLRDALRGGRRVAVLGAGWVGLEVAAAARRHGAHVTLLDPAPTPLHRELGPELGELFAEVHSEHGVDVRMGGTAPGAEAEVVVATTGLVPDVALAEAAGLAVGTGVLVDELLRTSDPLVYAAGEVAEARNALLGRRVRVEHWADAADQGYAAGRSMARAGEPWDALPSFSSRQYDLRVECRGLPGLEGYDEVVLRGGEDEGEDDETLDNVLAFWLRNGRIVAGMHIDEEESREVVERLVRARAHADAAKLADPGVPLDAFL